MSLKNVIANLMKQSLQLGMIHKSYFVYLMTNKSNTVIYTGVTNNLIRRVFEHKNKLFQGFTSKYNVTKLVYYEIFGDVMDCFAVLAMT